MISRRALVVAAMVLAAASLNAAADRERQRRGRDRDNAATTQASNVDERRSFTVGRGATIDVSNIAGDVRITGERGDTVVVQTSSRGSDRRRGSPPRVEMSQVGNRIEVRVRGGRSSGSSNVVDVTLTVPPDAVVLARSVSGHVALTGVDGDARLETVSGNVDLLRVANVTLAKSVSGDVLLRDSGSAGAMTLGTVSGAVVVSSVKARALEATSVSGAVRLTGIEASRVLAKSVDGDLEYEGGLAADGRYELTSHSGDVRLRLAAGAGFDLQAETFSGRLTSDFPVTLRSTRNGGSSRAIRGVAGDGGAQLVVRTFSGSVTIGRR